MPATFWPHTSRNDSKLTLTTVRRQGRRAFKGLMRSHHLRLPPKYNLPLRIRWWFVLITALVMVMLGLLGLTNWAHALPVNDKLLHFFCLGLATCVFYFIFDVEEEARIVWFWHRAPLILTAFVCILLGGIASEFVQALLPYKTFQFGDIVANLLGSSIGLYTAYHLERYYRHRREINRLYRPLGASQSSIHLPSDSEDEDGNNTGMQLLPTHNSPAKMNGKARTRAEDRALADVWDEREEVFGVGDDSDEDVSDEETGHAIAGKGKAGKSVRWADGSGAS